MTEKNRRTTLEAVMPEREVRLLQLPRALMETAGKLRTKAPETAARLAWHALAIALLIDTNLRLRNLIGLRPDQHLHWPGTGRNSEAWIRIAGSQTKNGQALEIPLSGDTSHLIRAWIDIYRPIIATRGNPFLFPGQASSDRPITPQSMRDAIKSTTRSHLGITITPHQFRHITARQFLEECFGHYDQVSLLLAHKDSRTTRRHYAGLEGPEAHRWHDAMLQARLARGLPRKKSPRKGG